MFKDKLQICRKPKPHTVRKLEQETYLHYTIFLLKIKNYRTKFLFYLITNGRKRRHLQNCYTQIELTFFFFSEKGLNRINFFFWFNQNYVLKIWIVDLLSSYFLEQRINFFSGIFSQTKKNLLRGALLWEMDMMLNLVLFS